VVAPKHPVAAAVVPAPKPATVDPNPKPAQVAAPVGPADGGRLATGMLCVTGQGGYRYALRGMRDHVR
jgi:hypothetical protein